MGAIVPWPGRDKLFDIDSGWLALTLFHTLNQTYAFYAVQLCKNLPGFTVSAAHILHDFIDRVIDIHTVEIIVPTVSGREGHTIQQQTIQQLGIGGQMLIV